MVKGQFAKLRQCKSYTGSNPVLSVNNKGGIMYHYVLLTQEEMDLVERNRKLKENIDKFVSIGPCFTTKASSEISYFEFREWIRIIDNILFEGQFTDINLLVSEGNLRSQYYLEVYGKFRS
jgi:hypothetical protein